MGDIMEIYSSIVSPWGSRKGNIIEPHVYYKYLLSESTVMEDIADFYIQMQAKIRRKAYLDFPNTFKSFMRGKLFNSHGYSK